MKKFKTILIIACIWLVTLGGAYWYGCYITNRDAKPDDPGGQQFIPSPGTAQGTLTLTDLRYYNEAMRFFITATGPGSGEWVISRPEKWRPPPPPDHIITLGLGGGYHCGYGLPGGSFGYMRRVGSLVGINVYLGPEIAISAADARTIAAQVWVKAAAVF